MTSDDEELARRLAREGRLEAGVLGRCLAEVAQLRGQGHSVSLAGYLQQRGLLSQGGGSRSTGRVSLPRRSLQPGDSLAGCRIEKELGRGGMGAVYLARDGANRQVALKVMLNAGKGLGRFERECHALAQLDHPGIVRLLHADLEGEVPCLVMEFVPGRDLEGVIEAGDVPLDAQLDMLDQVCRAVHHAHEQGIVHRDLKPANVLIDNAGTAKVTDFGLVRDMDRKTRLTATGATLGTPGYMAPEQVTDGKQVTHAADVFALGIMLFELLTGERPFSGDTAVQLIAQIVKKDPPSVSSLAPDVDPAWNQVCMKALAKAPEDRYPTALALAEAMAAVRRGELRAPSQTGKLALGLLAAALLVAAILGAVLAARGPSALDPEAQAARGEALDDAVDDLLAGAAPLASDVTAVARLQGELQDVRARAEGPEPRELTKAARRLQALGGLTALTQDDLPAARAALDELGEVRLPEARALRGALAVLEDGDDPRAALADLNGAMVRGLDKVELRGWRLLARGAIGLAGEKDAQDALKDAAAVEVARPLSEPEQSVRVHALLELGQVDEARTVLARLDAPPVDLRWDVALAFTATAYSDQTREALERLSALPAQEPPDSRRRELAAKVYAPAESLFGRPDHMGEPTASEKQRALDLCHLGLLLWPAGGVPEELVKNMLESAVGLGSGQIDGDPWLAVRLSDLVPEHLEVQRQISKLCQRIVDQNNKRRLLVAPRRAVVLETDRVKRLEWQTILCQALAFLNRRNEESVNLPECEECVEVATVALPRASEDSTRAWLLGSRAEALRHLGDLQGAMRDVNDAIELFGDQIEFHYTRMHVARGLGQHELALDGALVYANESDASERLYRAVLHIWIYLQADAPEKVIPHIEHMLSFRTTWGGWWTRLAWLYMRTGDVTKAQDRMRRALESFERPGKHYREFPELLEPARVAAAAVAGRGAAAEPELRAFVERMEAQRKARDDYYHLP